MRPFVYIAIAVLASCQVSIANAQYGSSGADDFSASQSYWGGSSGSWSGSTQSSGYTSQWAISQNATPRVAKRTVPAAGVSPNTRSGWIRHVTNHPEGVSVPYSVAARASMADLRRYHANQHAGLHWNADTVVAGTGNVQPLVRRRPFRRLWR